MDVLLRPDDPVLLDAVQEYLASALKGKEGASKPDWTPLHWFAAANDSDPVRAQAWVAAGGNPDTQTDKGDTPLHITAWRGSMRKSMFLLRLGASPNIPNHRGHTPLHQALRKKNASLACAMARQGGDWGVRDKDGMSGLSHALELFKEHLDGSFPNPPSLGEGTDEAALAEIVSSQPWHLWEQPFSSRSAYKKISDVLEQTPELSALASQVLARRMDAELPEACLAPPRRPPARL